MNEPAIFLKRRALIIALFLLLVVTFVALALFRGGRSGAPSPVAVVQEVAADPLTFARERVTGGIGVALAAHTNNCPRVTMVGKGSPAERAGVLAGDILLAIDNEPTDGKSLMVVVNEIRGLALGRVRMVVQRGGTNVELVVTRTSWNSVKKLDYK